VANLETFGFTLVVKEELGSGFMFFLYHISRSQSFWTLQFIKRQKQMEYLNVERKEF
jgi:hypothetical protein